MPPRDLEPEGAHEALGGSKIAAPGDKRLQVEGRTHFLDENQAPVESPTAWSRVYLPPHTIGTYQASSTAREQVDTYYIELREGT